MCLAWTCVDQGFYSECSSEFGLMLWITHQDSKILSPVCILVLHRYQSIMSRFKC